MYMYNLHTRRYMSFQIENYYGISFPGRGKYNISEEKIRKHTIRVYAHFRLMDLKMPEKGSKYLIMNVIQSVFFFFSFNDQNICMNKPA